MNAITLDGDKHAFSQRQDSVDSLTIVFVSTCNTYGDMNPMGSIEFLLQI